MKLRRFEYAEAPGTPGAWVLGPLAFGEFNLVVGKNSAGKTRTLRAIRRLAEAIITPPPNNPSRFQAQFASGDNVLQFQIPPDAAAGAMDGNLPKQWASRLFHFPFSSNSGLNSGGVYGPFLGESLGLAISQGGTDLLKPVLTDLEAIGHRISGIETVQTEHGPEILVHERRRPVPTGQRLLSQGLYRCIALLVWLNRIELQAQESLVLIDDFAEGLDYQHAEAFARLLLKKAEQPALQMILTTNDRFVMNVVPLEYWSILVHSNGHTRVINYQNARAQFDDFRFTGLNNFDFFSMDFAEGQDE